MTVRPITPEEKEAGFVVCGCMKYAHILFSQVLRRLPEGYSGERCEECNAWMCRLDYLIPLETVQGAD